MLRLWKWKVPEYQPNDPEHRHRQVRILKFVLNIGILDVLSHKQRGILKTLRFLHHPHFYGLSSDWWPQYCCYVGKCPIWYIFSLDIILIHRSYFLRTCFFYNIGQIYKVYTCIYEVKFWTAQCFSNNKIHATNVCLQV